MSNLNPFTYIITEMVKVNQYLSYQSDCHSGPKSKKQRQETSTPVNYSLFSRKITFEFLKTHLWAAADILRIIGPGGL